MLKYHTYALYHSDVINTFAPVLNGPGDPFQIHSEDVDQGTLSCAIWPDQANYLALIDFHGNVFDNHVPCGDIIDLQYDLRLLIFEVPSNWQKPNIFDSLLLFFEDVPLIISSVNKPNNWKHYDAIHQLYPKGQDNLKVTWRYR